MIPDLSAKPRDYVEIRDDSVAQQLLLHLGVIDKFQSRPTLTDTWATSVGYADHPTHWILATRFEGFPQAQDNGYFVQCFPKQTISLTEVNVLLRARNVSFFPDGFTEGSIPIRPPQS